MIKRILSFFSNKDDSITEKKDDSNTEKKNPVLLKFENYMKDHKKQLYIISQIGDRELREKKSLELDEEWKSQIYECQAEIGYFRIMKEAHANIINQIPLEIREAKQKEKKEN